MNQLSLFQLFNIIGLFHRPRKDIGGVGYAN